MSTPLPDGIGAPATRALEAAGVGALEDLARWREQDLLELHVVGPKAVAVLRAGLARGGTGFRAQRPDDEGPAAIDAWLDQLDEPHAASLRALRKTLRSVLPHADEGWSYGMPAVLLHGMAIAGYTAAAGHCSYAPMSGEVLVGLTKELEPFETSAGVLRFAPGATLPVGVVRTLVAARLAEVAAVTDGWRREYQKDGRLKAEGPMKDGELHGAWHWYRADGSLLRTGSFRAGERVGTWTTWTRDGQPA